MRPLILTSRIVFTSLLVLVCMSMGLQAQPLNQANQKGKVESMRADYLSHRLNLTSDEANQFWPVYNKYRADLTILRRNFFPQGEGSPHLDADAQLEFEQKKLDLKKTYKPQFEQAIGKDKVNQLVSAEEDFKRMLVETLRNRKQQRPHAEIVFRSIPFRSYILLSVWHWWQRLCADCQRLSTY